jgi:hypothetical protein
MAATIKKCSGKNVLLQKCVLKNVLLLKCGGPCVSCSGTQPSAVVSGTPGSASIGCNKNGTYPFNTFIPQFGGACTWIWKYDANNYVSVLYTSSGVWTIIVGDISAYRYTLTGGELLTCVDGVLTGTVNLSGIDACAGLTAQVVFG